MCKKNFIPISICFCVIALQSYREILKKYRKRAITLEKTIFQKFEKKPLELYTWGMLSQSFKALGWMVWLQSKGHLYPDRQPHPAELR